MLRHELSAIFGDMPNTEYAALLKSVQDNGFTHPKIITYEDKILDGWHRYRVVQHLGKESDLIFEVYEGDDPAWFVCAENLHRRHLTASQRGQMVVEAHEWATGGGDRMSDEYRTTSSNDEVVKTREEMAKQANVSTPTIDRAKQVSRAGRSEEVISGEKSASAVIQEEREKAVLVEQEDVSPFLVEVVDEPTPDAVPVSAATPDPTPEPVPEPTEEDILRVVLDSDMVIHDNALAMSSGILRKMPYMSAGTWKALRRNVLGVVHPDKVDMSDWTDEEKDSWTVLFEFLNRFLGELEIDYREYASVK